MSRLEDHVAELATKVASISGYLEGLAERDDRIFRKLEELTSAKQATELKMELLTQKFSTFSRGQKTFYSGFLAGFTCFLPLLLWAGKELLHFLTQTPSQPPP